MKKLLKVALVAIMAAAVTTGCSNSSTTDCPATVGLVTDTGGIDDKSFNEGTWNGIKAFFADANVDLKSCASYLQSNTEADYIPNLSNYADDQKDLIVAPGFLFETALTEVAKQFPEQKFLIIDSVVDLPNVSSAVFAEEQGSYLAGIAAGLVAKEAGQDKFGFIGGMDFELIQRFEAGFIAGVKEILPNATFDVQYAEAFDAPEKGQTIAAKMYDAGAFIIFHAAGGTGNGLITEAKARRDAKQDVWAIGVDSDQYEAGMMADGKSAVLTSMLKRVDTAAYATLQAVEAGEFKGGAVETYDLTNDGVGVELTKGRNLSDAIIAEVEVYVEKGAKGELDIPKVPERLLK